MSSIVPAQRVVLSYAGLVVGPVVWAINMQLGQLLPYIDCERHVRMSAIVSFAGAIVAILVGALSLSATRRKGAGAAHEPTWDFIGGVSGLTALVFAFALMLQGTASLVLSGCER